MSERLDGTVISYNENKGYGFLARGTCKADWIRAFFHIKQFTGPGIPFLGQPVTFELQPYQDGPHPRAINVEAK